LLPTQWVQNLEMLTSFAFGENIHGKLTSLKRFKDDVKEVAKGYDLDVKGDYKCRQNLCQWKFGLQ
jgi:translation initiation factor IF-2